MRPVTENNRMNLFTVNSIDVEATLARLRQMTQDGL